jgi:alkylhydroperoxidase family enzyme
VALSAEHYIMSMRYFFPFLFLGMGVTLMADESLPELKPGFPQPKDPVALQKILEKAYSGKTPPEAVRMFLAIMNGSNMGPDDGWFGPAQTKYTYAYLAKLHGIDPKNREGISKEQFKGSKAAWVKLDRNQDGKILAEDLDWSEENSYVKASYMINRIFRRMDVKGKGKISREEWQAIYDKAVGEEDGLTSDALTKTILAGYSNAFMPGDAPNRDMLLKGLFAGEIGSMAEGPGVGSKAPEFKLKKVDGSGSIALSSILGQKPLILVTGNFTCGPFRSFYPGVEQLYQKYQGEANFLMVYVREAHPTDGWKMESNTKAGVAVKQPLIFDERLTVANQFCTRLKTKIPVVVDDVNDQVGHAYSGMPARLYLIDSNGIVLYKGGRGPFGFKTPELEQALQMHLTEKAMTQPSRISLLPDEEIWQKLPAATKGGHTPLPNWAKVIAADLPRTAAAMLELDWIQRTKSPLNPALRAKMRYVVAKYNRCEYAQATALADLKRAGGDEATLKNPEAWPASEKAALKFAEDLSKSASTIPDAEFTSLREQYGDSGVAAMVLLAAYGNFQDRFLLGLSIPLESTGPMPPLDIQFAASAFASQPVLPETKAPTPLIENGKSVVAVDPEWNQLSFETLQSRLESQRDRKPRLPIPTWEEVKTKLPASFTTRPTRILWNLVCFNYVPELAVAWSKTTRTMWVEAPQDRVLEESLFWVQTRALQCNYCMGHCEMLLEVAGLDKQKVSARTRKLAGDDWSAFTPEEQRAYAYARKLTKTPWDLTPADYQNLVADYGPKNAMAIYFWLCRGLYMTRVSDGFQLPLERDNVFADYVPKK